MNRFIKFAGIGFGLVLWQNACKPATVNKDPQYIIDQSIKAHGSKVFDQSIIEFKMGNRFYKSTRSQGQFRYERFWDSIGVTIHDDLTKKGLVRQIDQTEIILDTKKIDNYSSSLRLAMYIFGLPFGFNDPAVIKTYLGEVILMEEPYHKIKITFRLNPNDRTIHDNIYVAWIHKKKFTLDYLGYLLNEPEEKGNHFLQALNAQKVEGLRVQKYKVYKPSQDSLLIQPEDLDQAWAANQLMLWSSFEVNQLKIRPK
ncbi:MAG: DUF6503 family protein [Saprospiraceae bacterium]|nr:DUF6503 family protein [Saprospiraceae bacterium]